LLLHIPADSAVNAEIDRNPALDTKGAGERYQRWPAPIGNLCSAVRSDASPQNILDSSDVE
jgi:hypothetical protein